MAVLHRISLKGPWEYVEIPPPIHSPSPASAIPAGRPPRIHLPASWGNIAERGLCGSPLTSNGSQVGFLRWFHSPTNLEEKESVWLVVEGVLPPIDVFLNGDQLSSGPQHISGSLPICNWEHNITPLLKPRNRLVIQLKSLLCDIERKDDSVWKGVFLEMRMIGE